MATPRDQPSNVVTEDALRPPDEAVVTSDAPQSTEPPAADPKAKKDPAAAKPGGSNDQDPEPGKKSKRNPPAERRIRKLRQQLTEEQSVNTTNAGRIADLEGEIETLKASQAQAPEPQREAFKTDQEYAKAWASWDTAATAKPKPKPKAKPAASTAAPPASAPIVDTDIADFQKRGASKLGDEFVEAMNAKGNAINTTMGEYILDHDLGPEIYVHLSNNEEEARKIFDMPPHKAVKALDGLAEKGEKGELDAGDEGELKVADPPDLGKPDTDPKKTPAGSGGKRPGKTKAPEPPKDTKPGDAVPAKSPEDESMDEYADRRGREERKRQGLPPI